MNECYDTDGDKIRRVGVASIKRVLNNLVNITESGEYCWATVSCPDAGVYVSRYNKLYETTWIDSVGSQYNEFHDTQRKAIDRFLELRKANK